ncbi:MAG: hypothetical protein ACOCZ8_06500 [Bacteroidota bacterium]
MPHKPFAQLVERPRVQRIKDRLNGYRLLHAALQKRGDEVRWVETALNMGIEFRRAIQLYRLLKSLTGLSPAHIEFIKAGNVAVFQDAYPRVQEALDGPVLKGEAAREWDRNILTREQHRLQPLYERMHNVHGKLLHFQKQLTEPGVTERWLLPTLTSQPFRGSLLNVEDRIDYGLRLMYGVGGL